MQAVVARFGPPSVHETKDNSFLVYAAQPCRTPCVTRLWWEHPVPVGIEAWSVECDADGKVKRKAHWVSP